MSATRRNHGFSFTPREFSGFRSDSLWRSKHNETEIR